MPHNPRPTHSARRASPKLGTETCRDLQQSYPGECRTHVIPHPSRLSLASRLYHNDFLQIGRQNPGQLSEPKNCTSMLVTSNPFWAREAFLARNHWQAFARVHCRGLRFLCGEQDGRPILPAVLQWVMDGWELRDSTRTCQQVCTTSSTNAQ